MTFTYPSHTAKGCVPLSSDVSVGGYSGGPVFDMGYEKMGCATATKEKTVLHGIVHGTMSDETGGKIALITPMLYIKDLI